VLLICILGPAVTAFPLDALIGDSAVRLGIATSLLLVLIAGPATIVPAVYAELFIVMLLISAIAIASPRRPGGVTSPSCTDRPAVVVVVDAPPPP